MKKPTTLQTGLSVLFTGCLLISNVITGRQVQFPFGITMTGAIFIFPITNILSDLFSEVYGYKWSRITCYFSFALNLLMAIVFTLVINAPSPSYWGGAEAYQFVLGNTPRVLVGSLLAFFFGDLVNDKVFRRMKERHPNSHKGYGVRAILSSVVGAAVDTSIFIPIAFLGKMPLNVLVVMGITQVCLKLLYELLVLPLNRYITIKVAAYEAK